MTLLQLFLYLSKSAGKKFQFSTEVYTFKLYQKTYNYNILCVHHENCI